jgi:arginine/lysine/ornithine decarboxylase
LLSQVTGGVLPYSSSDDTEGGLSVNNLDNSGSTVAMIFPQLQATNVTKFSGAIARCASASPSQPLIAKNESASSFHLSTKHRETSTLRLPNPWQ